jgi:hypothetical protein
MKKIIVTILIIFLIAVGVFLFYLFSQNKDVYSGSSGINFSTEEWNESLATREIFQHVDHTNKFPFVILLQSRITKGEVPFTITDPEGNTVLSGTLSKDAPESRTTLPPQLGSWICTVTLDAEDEGSIRFSIYNDSFQIGDPEAWPEFKK